MSWWAWILFWIVFWSMALVYLGWRCWKLWPHLRDFGRTMQGAFEQAESAAGSAAAVRAELEHSTTRAVSTELDIDALAWNRPAAAWRSEWRRSRRRRREMRLDDHAQTWARWRRVD